MQSREKRLTPAHPSIALSLNSIPAGSFSSARVFLLPPHDSPSPDLPEGLREEPAEMENFKQLLNDYEQDLNNIKKLADLMTSAFDVSLALRFGLENCIKNNKFGREITVQVAQWYLHHADQLTAYPAAHAVGLCAVGDCYNIGLPVPGTALAGIKEEDEARALVQYKEAYALVKQHGLNLPYAIHTRGRYSGELQYLEEAIKKNYPLSQGALAYRLHSKENPSNADFMRAEELAQAAAESGDAFGKAKLATLLKWRADRIQKENPNEAAGLRTKVTIWHVRARTQGQEMNNEFFNRFTAAYPAPVLTGCMILRRERYDVDSTISTIEAQHPEAAKQVYEAFTSQSTTTAEERAWLQGRIADLNKLKGSSKPSKHGYFGRNKPHKHDSHAASHSAGKHKQSGCGGGCNIM